MLKAVMAHPVLGPITRRAEYDAHPVGKPPIRYINTDRPAARSNVQVLGGKTGYNDVARYCLVVATKIDGRTYYMAFLGDEGKLTRFGDVARVADWIVSHKPKTGMRRRRAASPRSRRRRRRRQVAPGAGGSAPRAAAGRGGSAGAAPAPSAAHAPPARAGARSARDRRRRRATATP